MVSGRQAAEENIQAFSAWAVIEQSVLHASRISARRLPPARSARPGRPQAHRRDGRDSAARMAAMCSRCSPTFSLQRTSRPRWSCTERWRRPEATSKDADPQASTRKPRAAPWHALYPDFWRGASVPEIAKVQEVRTELEWLSAVYQELREAEQKRLWRAFMADTKHRTIINLSR